MVNTFYQQLSRRFSPAGTLSRREILGAAAAGAAGVLLSGCSLGTYLPPQEKAPRVVVVGAGLAGLACACELKAAGYRVAVVEARDRFGGRVRSARDMVGGKVVETGGEFISANHATFIAYAKKFKLELVEASDVAAANRRIVLQGKELDAATARSLHEEMSAAFATMAPDAATVNVDEPWLTPGAVALDRQTMADWLGGLKVSDLCRAAIGLELEMRNTVTIERQSYLANLVRIKAGGPTYWGGDAMFRCRGGSQQLANQLAEAVGIPWLTLKVPITQIVRQQTYVRAITADGRFLEGDTLVLAVPPMVWRTMGFVPPLQMGMEMQVGPRVKYLAVVRKAFGNDQGTVVTDGPLGMAWNATTGQDKESEAVMTACAAGGAATICRAWGPGEREAAYAAEFEKYYPGFKRNFVRGRFIDWMGEPYSLGGTSFPAPGELTRVAPSLHRGIGQIFFVGEHMCPKFSGTMEGALASGVALAKRLALRDHMPM